MIEDNNNTNTKETMMRTTMTMTDADYELLAKAVTFAEQGNTDDWDDREIDAESDYVTVTREPLSAFDEDRNWRECEGRQSFNIDGHPCVYWRSMQACKGDRREALTVIDLGDFRASYK